MLLLIIYPPVLRKSFSVMLQHRCVRTRFGVIQAAATLRYYRKRLNQAEEMSVKCLSQMQNNGGSNSQLLLSSTAIQLSGTSFKGDIQHNLSPPSKLGQVQLH